MNIHLRPILMFTWGFLGFDNHSQVSTSHTRPWAPALSPGPSPPAGPPVPPSDLERRAATRRPRTWSPGPRHPLKRGRPVGTTGGPTWRQAESGFWWGCSLPVGLVSQLAVKPKKGQSPFLQTLATGSAFRKLGGRLIAVHSMHMITVLVDVFSDSALALFRTSGNLQRFPVPNPNVFSFGTSGASPRRRHPPRRWCRSLWTTTGRPTASAKPCWLTSGC